MVGLRPRHPHVVKVTRPSLRFNAWRALQGNAFYAACQFGMLLVLARSQPVEEVGRYALALALAGPVFVLSDLRLRAIQVSRPHDTYVFGDYFGNRIVMSAWSVALVLGIAALADRDPRTLTTVAAVALLKLVEALQDVGYGAFEARERFAPVRDGMFFRGLGGLLAFGAALLATDKIEWAVSASLGVSSVALAWTLVRLRAIDVVTRPRLSRQALVTLTVLALPVGASFAIGILTTNLPRYALQVSDGSELLGIYAAVAYLPVLTNVVVDAVALAAAPRLSHSYATDDPSAFRSLMRLLVFVAVAAGALGVVAALLLGSQALRMVFGPEYVVGSTALAWLALAAALQYVVAFLRVGLLAMHRYRAPLLASIGNFATVAAVLAMGMTSLSLDWAAGAVAAGQVTALVAMIGLYRTALRSRSHSEDSAVHLQAGQRGTQ